MLIITLIGVALVTIFVCPLVAKDVYQESGMAEKKSEKTMREALDIFVKDHINLPPTLPEDVRQRRLTHFIYHSNLMIIRPNDPKADKLLCRLYFKDMKQKGKYNYWVKMEGQDKFGRSYLEGMILFTGEEMGIKLSKDYHEKKFATSSEEYSGTFLEGNIDEEGARGTWAIFGFRNSPKHSGTWDIHEH